MAQNIEKCLLYIEETKRELAAASEAMKADDKFDEGKLLAVRANICEVCTAILNVTAKRCANAEGAELADAFDKAMEKTSASWFARHEKAKEFHDFDTVAVEEAKIDAMRGIQARVRGILGGNEND